MAHLAPIQVGSPVIDLHSASEAVDARHGAGQHGDAAPASSISSLDRLLSERGLFVLLLFSNMGFG